MVPVLVDGDVVLSDEYEIIDYMKKTYPVES
jgi:glutathione S-transferase